MDQNDAAQFTNWMGGDVQDSLSVAVKGVLNQPGLGRRRW